jgi:rod shape determining protein RodA
MSRYVSFRDFDWLLLIFVLMICALGVMEIQSATVHTKFAGSHIRQIYWILAGVGSMLSSAQLITRRFWTAFTGFISLRSLR